MESKLGAPGKEMRTMSLSCNTMEDEFSIAGAVGVATAEAAASRLAAGGGRKVTDWLSQPQTTDQATKSPKTKVARLIFNGSVTAGRGMVGSPRLGDRPGRNQRR